MADSDLRELQRKADTGDDEARKALYRAKRRAGILPNWDEVKKHFADIIAEGEGPSKGKSGIVRIEIDSCSSENDCIYLELGTYDVGNWPSWTQLGPFPSMEATQKAFADKLDEAEKVVGREQGQDVTICPICYSDLGGIPGQPTVHALAEQLLHDDYDDLWCGVCQFSYFDCPACFKVYAEESDAGDCMEHCNP